MRTDQQELFEGQRMPRQPATSVAPRRNGSINNLLPIDRPAHDWYRFVLSFPPHLVRDYADRFQLNPDSLLLDPFCGTGTTIVEGKKLGVPAVGIEAVPMSLLASQTKVDWSPNPDRFKAHAEHVAERALALLEREGVSDDPSENQGAHRKPNLRSLPETTAKLLLKGSISPLPLHKVLALLEALDDERSSPYYRHELVALAKLLPTEVGNLRFGPEVGVGAIKQDAPVVGSWLSQVWRMAEDLRGLSALNDTPAKALSGDARDIGGLLAPHSVDAVICSPPYPNEKDYLRIVRLESVLLGLIEDKPQLRSLKQSLVRSNTRGVYKADEDDKWIRSNENIARIAAEIEDRRIALGKDYGFERAYHRVTKLYFGGMARHFRNLSEVLRPGARLAYVVGDQASYLRVMIRTAKLLAEVAESQGYELEGIDLFRTRHATATRAQLREEVLLLRWPGKIH